MSPRRSRAAVAHSLPATRALPEPTTAIAKPRARSSSFIGPDLQIQGCLISTSDVHVEGYIDGDCVCRQLVIKFADGTSQYANFIFK